MTPLHTLSLTLPCKEESITLYYISLDVLWFYHNYYYTEGTEHTGDTILCMTYLYDRGSSGADMNQD